ncbi:hypothetical protein [Streptomyces sp. NPDC019937]|uniref:hypothetical protein n=1 Tax=Streptomyces sp. NPDC019937 TaxID=3154787 RepID=UPI003405823D
MMEAAANVLVAVAMLAAFAVAVWPRDVRPRWGFTVLTALIGTSLAVTIAVIATAALH